MDCCLITQRRQHRKPNPCWAPVGPREAETLGKTTVSLNTHYFPFHPNESSSNLIRLFIDPQDVF